jgi:hypothetical protein
MSFLDDSLQYLTLGRGSDKNRGGHEMLFTDGNIKQSMVVGRSDVTLNWHVPQEFGSPHYDEPLECVHARRRAFGGGSLCVEFETPIPADLPERCLLSQQVHSTEYRRGFVRLRWLLDTVFEVPGFCVGVAMAQRWRVDPIYWSPSGDSLEFLQAAMQIKPRPHDVIGVYTADFQLQGVVEFAEHVADDIYLGHLIAATEQRRQLLAGEQLFARHSGLIGKTTITAERCVFEVLEVGDQPIPPFRSDRRKP